MRTWSLRSQLVALGLLASVVPLVLLVGVVFQVETETIDSSVNGQVVDVSVEDGVSPWVPAAAAVLAVGAVAAVWLWAKRAVAPIETMTALSNEVQAGSLDQRLHLDSAPVELRELGASFDRMLDRLASASEQERRLLEDASHELRTPLAALAARLEVARGRNEPNQTADDLALCELEIERLQATLDALLSSARSRQASVEQVDNDVAAIVSRVVERQRLLTPDVPITVAAPAAVLAGVDGASVDRAIANLVANAAQYGAGSPVTVTVTDASDQVSIAVVDHGPGIEPDRLPRIFDRYDGDDHGIGLALVKQVADAYGSIDVESPLRDGSGTRFVLRIDRQS